MVDAVETAVVAVDGTGVAGVDVDGDEVEAGAVDVVVVSGWDRCRPAELQPAARTVPMPTAAAALAKLIDRIVEVSGRRGNNYIRTVTFYNAKVVFNVACASGATPSSSTFTVTMPNASYTITDNQGHPAGNLYQGGAPVLSNCGNGQLSLKAGGTFSATINAS